MKKLKLLFILTLLHQGLWSQSVGRVKTGKNPFAVAMAAEKNKKENSNKIGGGTTGSPTKTETPIAQLELTCDLEGKIWIDKKNYELKPNVPIQIPLYKEKTNYYFVSNEEFTKKDDINLNEDQKNTKIIKALSLRKELEYFIFKKRENTDKELILKTIFDNFVAIHVDEDIRDAQIGDFEISRFETTLFQFALYKNEMIKEQLKREGADSSYVLLRNSNFERAFVKGIDWRHDPSGVAYNDLNSNYPVSNVNWEEAMQFAEWLTAKDKYYRYRLPTVKEWEYAAGCGAYRFPFPWGDALDTEEIPANTADITLHQRWSNLKNYDERINDKFDMTAPVGQFTPNCFGLYDMAGNVAEWCLDTSVDIKSGAASKHFKGGSYFSLIKYCEIKINNSLESNKRHGGIGIRLCRVPK